MASGMGRREVPDSEDEPMTSSPVNASDGASDKLFATARVPLQDAQDALQEATGTHQATADNAANFSGKGSEGLDADQNDASIDVDAPKDVPNDMQSDTTTSSKQQLTEASNTTAHPLLSGLASPPEVENDHVDAQRTATNTSSASEQEAERDLMDEPNATTASETNIAPRAHNLEQMIGRDRSETAPHDVASELSKQHSSSEATHDARQIVGPGEEQSRAGESATDSTGDQRDDLLAHAEALVGDLNVKHSMAQQDAHARTEAANVALNDSDQHSSGNRAPENESPSNSIDHDITSVDHSALKRNMDVNMDWRSEPNSNPNYTNPAPASSHFESQQVPTQAGSLVSKVSEEPAALPEVTSTQAQEKEANISEQGAGTEGFDTAMDVEPFPSTSTTDTQNTTTDTLTSSGHSTNTMARTSAPDTEAGQNPIGTTDTPVATALRKAESPAPPTAPIETSEPAKTPQEITLAELRAQKSAMLASLAALPAIQVLMEEQARATNASDNDDEPTEADIMLAANKIVKDHIKLLHEYNELKDVGQGLMGLIADQRGVRIVEVNEEFGIEEGD